MIKVIVPPCLKQDTIDHKNKRATWLFDFDGSDYKIHGTWNEASRDVVKTYRINFEADFAEINLLGFAK